MKQTMIGVAIVAALTMTACGRSSNVSTQSAVTGAPNAGGAVLVPAGTRVDGRLQTEISTSKDHDGDTFTIAEQDTLMHKNPALHGAVVEGHLENVSAAGFNKKPSLTLVFDDIRMADGTTAPIAVRVENMGKFDAKTHHWRTIGMMVGAGIAGHIAAGKHNGGKLGAAGAYVLSQEMKTNVDVKPGTLIELRFLQDAVAQGSPAASPSGQ